MTKLIKKLDGITIGLLMLGFIVTVTGVLAKYNLIDLSK